MKPEVELTINLVAAVKALTEAKELAINVGRYQARISHLLRANIDTALTAINEVPEVQAELQREAKELADAKAMPPVVCENCGAKVSYDVENRKYPDVCPLCCITRVGEDTYTVATDDKYSEDTDDSKPEQKAEGVVETSNPQPQPTIKPPVPAPAPSASASLASKLKTKSK